MPLDAISIDSMTEDHLQRLVQDREQESKAIEFKQELPGPLDADKKEFLADFTSFANTVGGDLIFGIRAPSGIAEEVVGLEGDLDAQLNRLENIIRTGIQHRVMGYSAKLIPLVNGRKILVFRIPRSWALPHRVTLGGHDKFYARHTVGKYQLDVPQLQNLFLLSATTAERIRDFRMERLARINGNETPVSMAPGPKTILHVIPLNAFAAGTNLNVSVFESDIQVVRPIQAPGGLNYRHNFDGFVTFSVMRDSDNTQSYAQVFRNGSIEAVDGRLVREYDGQRLISGYGWEQALIDVLPSYFHIQSLLNIQPPVFIMLSVLGVRGYTMYLSPGAFETGDPIDRDMLIVPEVMVENFSSDPAQLLKPAFDVIWNATGFSGSGSYDAQGQRTRR